MSSKTASFCTVPSMKGEASRPSCSFVRATTLPVRPVRDAQGVSARRAPTRVLKRRRRSPRCEFAAGTEGAMRQELELVSALVGSGGLRLRLSDTVREKVELAAQVLETGAGGAAVQFPEDLSLLDGTWTLLYSSEINSVPRGATAVRQRFAVAERRVENCVFFALVPPRLPGAPETVAGEIVLGASFAVVDKDTITLKLVDFQFRVQQPLGDRMRDLTPRLPLPDWQFPMFLTGAARGTSADVRTTYYGEEIRVARSSGGELRIFCKQK